jgi:aldehyde:ferredoxin oxidoreductase
MEVSDCSGLCSFALLMGRPPVREWINATTGWQFDDADLMKIGHRIQIARHLFNQRAGVSPNDRVLPHRPSGDPPAQQGPLRGITLDVAADVREYRETLGLDLDSGRPSPALLESLGLAALAGSGEEVIP